MNGKFQADSLFSIPLTLFYTSHSLLMYSAISKDGGCVSSYLYLHPPPLPTHGHSTKNAQDDGPGRACHINQIRCYAIAG